MSSEVWAPVQRWEKKWVVPAPPATSQKKGSAAKAVAVHKGKIYKWVSAPKKAPVLLYEEVDREAVIQAVRDQVRQEAAEAAAREAAQRKAEEDARAKAKAEEEARLKAEAEEAAARIKEQDGQSSPTAKSASPARSGGASPARPQSPTKPPSSQGSPPKSPNKPAESSAPMDVDQE